MVAKTPEIADQIADYAFNPKDLDPEKVLLCLPGWRFEEDHPLPLQWTWHFHEPDDRLSLEIIRDDEEEGRRNNQAIIHRLETRRIATSVYVHDLKLILAQVRPTAFSIGLYSPDGSCYLTMDRSDSAYLPEYTVTYWAGRDSQKVPSWKDYLPFRSHSLNPRLYFQLAIPRVA